MDRNRYNYIQTPTTTRSGPFQQYPSNSGFQYYSGGDEIGSQEIMMENDANISDAGDPAMWAPRHSLPGEYTIPAQTHNSTYRMRSPVAYLGPEIHPPGPYSDRRSSNDSSLGNGVYSAPAYPGYSLPPMRRREPLPSNSYAMQPVDRRPAPSSYEYYDKESFNTSYGESDPLLDTTSSSSDLDLSQYEVPIIEDLYSGKEKRTVVMIRNIPNRYKVADLEEIFNLTAKNNFKIIYLPQDNKTLKNLGYAFIRFFTTTALADTMVARHGQLWPNSKSVKKCLFYFAHLQKKNKKKKKQQKQNRSEKNSFSSDPTLSMEPPHLSMYHASSFSNFSSSSLPHYEEPPIPYAQSHSVSPSDLYYCYNELDPDFQSSPTSQHMSPYTYVNHPQF